MVLGERGVVALGRPTGLGHAFLVVLSSEVVMTTQTTSAEVAVGVAIALRGAAAIGRGA
jgi:hypothetical protein